MSNFIPLSVPSIKGNEWKYVKECLDTEWVSSAGKYVDLFEQKIAEYTGARYAVACVSGTSAIHISLLVAGVRREDEVIVPTLTFIAPINAIHYCGARPVFMDSDKYYNIDPEKTVEFIKKETELRRDPGEGNSLHSYNKTTGKRVSALIPVNVFGNAVWFDELYDICGERNIKIIEDATESLGTKYIKGKFKGKSAGTVGDLGCLSFNGNKIITTGGGGMILTDNENYANRAKYLTTQAKDDEVRYVHNEIGYNYRLTNIQAAIGVAQLEQLPEYIRIKKENYNYYQKQINDIEGLFLAEVPGYSDNNYWMYALQIENGNYGKDKEQLMNYLKKYDIQTRPIWQLNHQQKKYKRSQSYFIEKAEIMFQKTLNIPCSVNLKKETINGIVEKLNER